VQVLLWRIAPLRSIHAGTILGGLLCLLGVSACSGQSPPAAMAEGRRQLGEGVELRRHRPGSDSQAPMISALYVDPSRYELRLLTAQNDGPARTVKQWCTDFGLLAGVNASMYLPNLRSTGWMIAEDRVNNGAVNPAFGGILAFGSRREGIPPFRFFATDCEDSVRARVRRDYRSLVQNYRLLDCEAEGIGWKDPKKYSSAAVGLDERGWIVFLHSGDPCRTTDLGRWLAEAEWGLKAAHFVEGGPDATLYVRWQSGELEVVGSYQSMASTRAREVPNVLGLIERE
jgi:Phosphodiester glycosidase